MILNQSRKTTAVAVKPHLLSTQHSTLYNRAAHWHKGYSVAVRLEWYIHSQLAKRLSLCSLQQGKRPTRCAHTLTHKQWGSHWSFPGLMPGAKTIDMLCPNKSARHQQSTAHNTLGVIPDAMGRPFDHRRPSVTDNHVADGLGYVQYLCLTTCLRNILAHCTRARRLAAPARKPARIIGMTGALRSSLPVCLQSWLPFGRRQSNSRGRRVTVCLVSWTVWLQLCWTHKHMGALVSRNDSRQKRTNGAVLNRAGHGHFILCLHLG